MTGLAKGERTYHVKARRDLGGVSTTSATATLTWEQPDDAESIVANDDDKRTGIILQLPGDDVVAQVHVR